LTNDKANLVTLKADIQKEFSQNKEIDLQKISSDIDKKLISLNFKYIDTLAEDWFDQWVLTNS